MKALVLATAFLGGGLGLPDLDALLYHQGRAAASPDVAHFDLPGGCGAHAEHCVLEVAASLRQVGSTVSTGVRITRSVTVLSVALPVAAPRSADRTNLQPSRAPPLAAS